MKPLNDSERENLQNALGWDDYNLNDILLELFQWCQTIAVTHIWEDDDDCGPPKATYLLCMQPVEDDVLYSTYKAEGAKTEIKHHPCYYEYMVKKMKQHASQDETLRLLATNIYQEKYTRSIGQRRLVFMPRDIRIGVDCGESHWL